MFFSRVRLSRIPLSICLCFYLAAAAAVVFAISLVVSRSVASLGQHLASSTASSTAAVTNPPPGVGSARMRREARMTLLADRTEGRWDGRWSDDGRAQSRTRAWSRAPQFGSSSRNPDGDANGENAFGWDGDDERPPPKTYRTVCVRLCDGYYFPISFSVTADRLGRDQAVCESRCGAQGRLFVQHSPGGTADDLQDLAGRPYRQLRTAFLYRSEYVSSCTCQPQPWEQASLDRHRLYALTAAARKGDVSAVKEMLALQARVKVAAKPAPRPAITADPSAPANPAPEGKQVLDAEAAARAADIAAREDGDYMGLGGGAPRAKSEPKSERSTISPSSDRDWVRRALQSGAGS